MSRPARAVTAASVASLCLVGAVLLAGRGGSPAGPGAVLLAPTTADVSTAEETTAVETSAVATSEALISVAPMSTSTTVALPGFVDGEAASAAAEQLLVPYIASEQGVEVTEPACSQPSTGAVGETFACYALKAGDLVVALRATIGDDRLITLELITEQMATTTTTSSTSSTTTTTTTVAAPPELAADTTSA